MSPTPRQRIAYPAPDEVDSAPQLLVVALADAALLAVERALDSAHPILTFTRCPDQQIPLLLSTERLAIQVLEATDQLAALLREYLDSVQFDLQDFHDDAIDPF